MSAINNGPRIGSEPQDLSCAPADGATATPGADAACAAPSADRTAGAWAGHSGDIGASILAARAARPSGGFAAIGAAPADPKTLDPKVSKAIIASVMRDEESFKRIDSWLATALPDGLGITGSLRNWGYVLTAQDPTSDRIANKVCTGIAEATWKAIERGMKDGTMPEVARADTIDRKRMGVYHTATLVTLKDGREFVFDWHATLNPANPAIMPKADWLKGSSM
jgi:hypothetical protein